MLHMLHPLVLVDAFSGLLFINKVLLPCVADKWHSVCENVLFSCKYIQTCTCMYFSITEEVMLKSFERITEQEISATQYICLLSYLTHEPSINFGYVHMCKKKSTYSFFFFFCSGDGDRFLFFDFPFEKREMFQIISTQ